MGIDEKQIAKEALGQLTRLRQGVNPFDSKKLAGFLDDEKKYKVNCGLLGIDVCYGNGTMNMLKETMGGETG